MAPKSFPESTFGKAVKKLMAAAMESRFRYRFFNPEKILHGANLEPGQTVLEIGSGTGYFTLPAARLIGATGRLVSLDVLPESTDLISRKVQAANLPNVSLVTANAMETHLESAVFDVVILFGVIPAPRLPLNRLLPEIHRLLKAGGILAVWPPVPGWLPGAVLKTGLFSLSSQGHGVYNFRQAQQ